jgi:hypothetical protein
MFHASLSRTLVVGKELCFLALVTVRSWVLQPNCMAAGGKEELCVPGQLLKAPYGGLCCVSFLSKGDVDSAEATGCLDLEAERSITISHQKGYPMFDRTRCTFLRFIRTT